MIVLTAIESLRIEAKNNKMNELKKIVDFIEIATSEQECDEETQDEIDQFYLYMREEAAALDRKMLKMIKQTYKQELKKFLNLSIEGK